MLLDHDDRAEGDQREHLAGAAGRIRQRDVAEQLDVDDRAGEHLDPAGLPRDERERLSGRGEGGEDGRGGSGHDRSFVVGAAA